MVGMLLFVLGLAAAGGAVAAAHGLIPPLGAIPRVGTGLIFGTLAGGIIGAGIWYGWKGIERALKSDGAVTRLMNGLFLGAITTMVGGVLIAAIALAFGGSVGAHIAQGCVLAGSLFLGVRIGSAFDRPLYPVGGAKARAAQRPHKNDSAARKVLDTSVIIDGRIGDLVRTGFLEGELIVPEFVLSELQGIADSANSLRRRKGRRGLEVLRSLMQDDTVRIRVISKDYPHVREVDRKLIHLVKDDGGALVTTDYNLNRVAQVEGVKILNINELANAVKPRFIPGEEITVEVIDRGEEIGQGVGYLDDGTMVVVENGRRHIGRKIKAMVKSTLQTEAGRMLFVEPAGETPRWEK
ncbi:PIN domain nuclease [Candidatus Acetothermia bacterium]|nr:MAG: PIN domain nuclease [Candidatus Acetothermia bacterium]